MTFVSPLFLWALTAIAVPIVIHLFNFRKYQKVYFTNVRFLRELQVESKSKSRLKELLILACRCLAIASLVFAFSQPYIPVQNTSSNASASKAISIYIDNSFSMQNVTKQGPIFDLAKKQAKDLVNVSGNADKFQLVTNDFEGKHQRFLYKEDALEAIEELKISSSVRNMADVLSRQTDFLKNSANGSKKIYLFSDAQRSTFNLLEASPDSTIPISLITMQANLEKNVFIDTCWFESPLQQKGFVQKLHARIKNASASEIKAGSAKLYINKQQIALSSFSIAPDSKTELIFSFECKLKGYHFASLKIEDYPISFDDELFFAFNSRMNISVCLINGKDQKPVNPFTSLFKTDSLFTLNSLSEQSIDYNVFKSCDVLILNQISEYSSGLLSELVKFSQKGGAIVYIPDEHLKISETLQCFNALNLPGFQYLDSIAIKTEKIELNSDFYRSVFEKLDDRVNLPLVNKHYTLNKNKFLDFENLLLLQNGETFLGRNTLNNARVYLFTAPFSENASNFTKHALFVPTFYQIAFGSVNTLPLFYTVKTNQVIPMKASSIVQDQAPHIIKTDQSMDVIPEWRHTTNQVLVFTQQQITEPGFYELTYQQASLLPLAFNYSRKESDLRCYGQSELEKIIQDKGWHFMRLINGGQSDFTQLIIEGNEGQRLWKLFIILALLFLAIELALLRLLK